LKGAEIMSTAMNRLPIVFTRFMFIDFAITPPLVINALINNL
jgi:hypothetical protein